MNFIIEPLLTSIERQSQAIKSLTTLGLEGMDKIAQLNTYASLAAIDNSTHHISTLAMTKDFDELVELQIKSVVPAFESAKAYASQVFALTVGSNLDLGQFSVNRPPYNQKHSI
jgi:phasin family protein